MIGPALGASFAAALSAEGPQRITVLYDAFGRPSSLETRLGLRGARRVRGKAYPLRYRQRRRDLRAKRESPRRRPDKARRGSDFPPTRRSHHGTRLPPESESRSPYFRAPGRRFLQGECAPGVSRSLPALPPHLRYYEGNPPEKWVSGTPWVEGNFEIVTATRRFFPGFTRSRRSRRSRARWK